MPVPQQTLTTDRLRLVPLADEHLEHEVALDADPEVLRYVWGRARTRAEVERDHVDRLERARKIDGLGLWAGFLLAEPGGFVGLWFLQPPHGPHQTPAPGEAELGYRLRREVWRQGLASEGSRALVRHGFEDLRLHRIFAQTMAVNTASRATMAALGMTYARTIQDEHVAPLPGSEQGEVEYELARDQWRMVR